MRNRVLTSETVRIRSAGTGSDRGVANWDAKGVAAFDLVNGVGAIGVGAGWRTFTLYAGTSGSSGCWITGAEVTSLSFGISENLF